jgi:hypothetical protein
MVDRLVSGVDDDLPCAAVVREGGFVAELVGRARCAEHDLIVLASGGAFSAPLRKMRARAVARRSGVPVLTVERDGSTKRVLC